jgi:outer membrane immunogenic protein
MRQHLMLSSAVVAMSLWAGISVQPAAAADMPIKAPAAPIADPAWTGWYLGLNAGGDWSASKLSTSTTSVPGAGLQLSALAIGLINGLGSPTDIHSSGFTGGAQGGYNYQIGQWLVGVEADIEHLRNAGSLSAATAPGTFNLNSSVSTDWLFTARPRLGVISNNWLFYGTGGLAVTRISGTWNLAGSAGIAENAAVASTKAGWVAGGGIETMLPGKWLVGAEYLYVNVASVSAVSSSTSFGTPLPNPFSHAADLNANIVRVRLSKLF